MWAAWLVQLSFVHVLGALFASSPTSVPFHLWVEANMHLPFDQVKGGWSSLDGIVIGIAAQVKKVVPIPKKQKRIQCYYPRVG